MRLLRLGPHQSLDSLQAKVKAGIISLSEVLRMSHADEFVGSGKQANKKNEKKRKNHKNLLHVLPGYLIK